MSRASFRRAISGTVLSIALCFTIASPAVAIEPADPWYVTAGRVAASTFDVILLRPLGLVATAGGFGFYVAALPFTAINRDIETPWEIFVLGPADYTFLRPLGDF